MAENRYITGYAKLGTSSCKKCKQKIDKGGLRIGKVVSNPFSDEGGDMKQWYHPQCMFETLKRARATTKKIEEPDDLEGFTEIEQSDKDLINKLIKEFATHPSTKSPGSAKKKATSTVQATLPFSPTKQKTDPDDEAGPSTSALGSDAPGHRDDSFREFRRLCAEIAEESSYLAKTKLVHDFINKGSSGDGFKGDIYLWMKCLLPGVVKQVYNLNSKQLVKLFSQIFGTSQDDMVADLDQGDVAETVRLYFEESKRLPPQKKSLLSLQQVDDYLNELSKVTKEDDQQRILTKVAKRCTGNDLKMFVRLIKHDLRINSGAKHILDALDDNAYAAFQASRNLRDVVDRVMENKGGVPGMKKKLSVKASLMTPVLPMLAEACRSVDQAMKKCPNGFYAEIKYDGERVQLHKKGHNFQYFSRSLKPVLPHKVQHFKEFIPKAFPTGDDLILDAEVLLVDNKTSKPLPFGTLGVHKKAAFQDANVCLFVFDCLHLNGENIMQKPIKERKKILETEMEEIPNRVVLSEAQLINDPDDLQTLMTKVFKEGLEGLVLKDINSKYEPGKRHWLKIKKDYLEQGTMADSADLVVLGAYFGTGNKGGIMSIFLLGVYDPSSSKWCTVTKCHSGLDDKTLEELQTSLDMVKISKNADKVPSWLNVKKQVVPDFVTRDPKKSPVWEISGAEFSKADIHTADGISIRFPRITKFRDDKNWENATDLPRLRTLFKKSKETTDLIPSSSKGTPKKKPLKDDDEDNDNNNEGDDSGTDINSDDDTGKSPMKTTPAKNSATPSKTTPLKATPTKNGVKRKHSDTGNGEITPSKKSKPMCKYGADCYQTNTTHLEQFDHPPKTLPNVFRGCKIFLPTDTKLYTTLRRYIIGWDGELVPEYDKASATHVILDKGHKVVDKEVKAQSPWGDIAQTELDEALRVTANTNVAKNVIVFLGDGMSISTVTASRILQGRLKAELGEGNYLAFEKFPNSGLIKTYCNDRTTPDSASTATAILCGVKTNIRTLGVKDSAVLGNCTSQAGNEVESILDWFHADGRSTGIVTTARITHATPGAGYAHSADREWEGDSEMEGVTGGCKDIAYQLVKENQHIQVLFGGGRYYFLPNTTNDPKHGDKNVKKQRRDGLDLTKEWQNDKSERNLRSSYVWTRQQLMDIDPEKTDYALGLFNDGHLSFELDKDNDSNEEPSLAEMTQKAIRILRKNPKGFFLLVEGARIDSAHHDNNAKRALYETLAFETAIRGALELVDASDTLVLVTADHSHSLLITGYASRHNSLFGYVDKVRAKYRPRDGVLWTTLLYGTGPGYDWGLRTNKTKQELESKDYIQAAASPRTSGTHDGQDVAVYARGPMSHLLTGVHEQHYINYVMTYAACVGRHKHKCMRESRLINAGAAAERSALTLYGAVFGLLILY